MRYRLARSSSVRNLETCDPRLGVLEAQSALHWRSRVVRERRARRAVRRPSRCWPASNGASICPAVSRSPTQPLEASPEPTQRDGPARVRDARCHFRLRGRGSVWLMVSSVVFRRALPNGSPVGDRVAATPDLNLGRHQYPSDISDPAPTLTRTSTAKLHQTAAVHAAAGQQPAIPTTTTGTAPLS